MATKRDGTEPLIQGQLTYLRAAERDDIPLFLRWINDRRTTRFLSTRGPLGTPLEERFFERMVDEQGKETWFFVICLLEDDRPIGNISLFAIDHTNGNAGLGVLIGDPGDTGRGLGSDAIAAILDFGFGQLRLERIWLDVYDFNERARRVYERLGFVHEGTLRRAVFHDGRYDDIYRMALLRDEWRSPLTEA
jgi:RimJ/RimL family protein N-acetyltransferase